MLVVFLTSKCSFHPRLFEREIHCLFSPQFEFTDFRLEDSIRRDYVAITNGHSITSMELGRYSGSSVPQSVGPSMSNTALIHFVTDESNAHEGFRLQLRQHDAG